MKDFKEDRFIVSVKVGPKGQITIPAQARKLFKISVGDTLMILGDVNKGIAIVKDDEFYKILGGTFDVGNKND